MNNKEIIEKVGGEILEIIGDVWNHDIPPITALKEILSHPNMAIIDPDAELPDLKSSYWTDWRLPQREGYEQSQQDILKGGWKKVVNK